MSDEERLRLFARLPKAEALSNGVLAATFADPMAIEAFWFHWYLDGFVDQGNGKVKCLVGRPGSGKTHLLRHLGQMSRDAGYGVALVDAGQDRISLIDELYRLVARQIPWNALLEDVLTRVIADELGYPEFTGLAGEFVAWAESTRSLSANLVRRDLREAIDFFLKKADLDAEFSLAVRGWLHQLVSGEPLEKSPAEAWLLGAKIGVSERKTLGLRNNLTRRNARAALASLASLLHQARRRGLLVLIDNIGAMASTTRVEGRAYYTRGTRDQAYEMIRQLVDESPFTPYLMTILAGEQGGVTNSRTGFPSYPALWARLQNEVQSPKPNRFADLVDLDQLWDEDRLDRETWAVKWRGNVLAWNETWAQEPEVPTSMGLEWGYPRRMVVAALGERLLETGGSSS